MDLENATDAEFEAYMNSGQLDTDVPEEQEPEPIEEEAGTQTEVVESAEEIKEEEVITPEATEQPNTDSENAAEEEVTTEAKEEDPKEDETEAAESTDETEGDKSEASEEVKTKSEDDVLSTYLETKTKVRGIGAEFEFSNKEKLETFDKVYAQAMDYTKKTQELAKHRKRISAMDELGITDDQFNTMLDVLKGDKDAITSVLKQTGVDAIDLDTEQELNYTPGNYGKSNVELDIKEAYETIDADPEGQITRNVIANQWDDASRDQMVSGMTLPNGKKLSTKELIAGLHEDVKKGKYNRVYPEAVKLQIADGGKKSILDYYIEAGAVVTTQDIQQEQAKQQAELVAKQKAEAEAKIIAEVKAKQKKEADAKADAEKRKAAGVTQTTPTTNSGTDYLAGLDNPGLTDEEFMKLMEKQVK